MTHSGARVRGTTPRGVSPVWRPQRPGSFPSAPPAGVTLSPPACCGLTAERHSRASTRWPQNCWQSSDSPGKTTATQLGRIAGHLAAGQICSPRLGHGHCLEIGLAGHTGLENEPFPFTSSSRRQGAPCRAGCRGGSPRRNRGRPSRSRSPRARSRGRLPRDRWRK